MKHLENPEISVIMSVYNPSEKHLSEAVNSIINQSFKNWEMIICDDGSNSCYGHIIKKSVMADPRIRLIRNNENTGLAASLNRCIKNSRGRYIARMDDDDISKKDRLKKEYYFLEKNRKYSWVGTGAELIDDRGVWGHRILKKKPQAKDYLEFLPFIHPSVMFRKELFDICKYPEIRRGEDYAFFMHMHAKGFRGYNIQEELFSYREDEHNYKRRKYEYQIQEAVIRFHGFKDLGLLKIKNTPYVFKPLITGVIPYKVQTAIKKIRTEKFAKCGEIQ